MIASAALIATLTSQALAQTGVDLCANAVSVGPGSYDPNITNSNAPIASNPDGGYSSCGLTVQQVTLAGNDSSQAYQRDVWFRYVPSAGFSGQVQIDGISCPSRGLNISVLSTCGGSELQCAPNACNVPIIFAASAAAGPYLVRVASYGNTSFDGGQQSPIACRVRFIELAPVTGQPGESCTHPKTISAAGSPYLIHHTTTSTDGVSPSCSANDSGRNALWFTYTAALTGSTKIAVGDNVGSSAASNDSRIIFSGYATCGGQELSGLCDPSGAPGSLTFYAVAGQTYLIRAAASSTGFLGQRTLTVTENAAPANDNCNGATLVTGPTQTTWTDVGTSANPPYSNCGWGATAAQRDLWFEYIPATAGTTSIDVGVPLADGTVTSQNIDTTIAVFTSCTAPSGSEIVCVTRGGPTSASNTARWWAALDVPTAGVPYWIRISRSIVSPNTTTAHPGKLRIREFPNRIDDACAGATTIGTGTFNWDSSGAHDDDQPTAGYCGGGQVYMNGGIWFKFIPPQTGLAKFDVGYQAGHGSDFIDTILEAYTGSCGALTISDCNDNRNGGQNPPDWISLISGMHVTAGEPVYLRLGINATGGNNNYYYQYGTLTASIVTPPPGDECASPATIPPEGAADIIINTTNASINAADPPYGECTVDGSGIGHDVWYSWTPVAPGHVIIDTCGVAIGDQLYNTTIAVYNTCNSAAIYCDTDSGLYAHDFLAHCTNAQSYVEFDVIPNTTYLIRVGGGPAGQGRLRVDFTPDFLSSLLGSASVQSGTGTLDTIAGQLGSRGQVDVYKIRICDPQAFTASTINSGTAINTAMMLFTLSGQGVAYADESDGVFGPNGGRAAIYYPFGLTEGNYYLAVTTGTHYVRRPNAHGRLPVSAAGPIWNAEPRDVQRTPDGPGSGGVLTGWTGSGDFDPILHSAPVPYLVELTGACRVFVCVADFDGSGVIGVQDIFDYLNAWFAGNPRADVDGGGISVQDIFDFLNLWFAGCP
jgi:hypothetical protein